MQQCPRCGQDIESNAVFCSNCGRKLDTTTQPLKSWNADAKAKVEDATQGCGMTMGVIGVALLVVLIVVGIGAAAIYAGIQDRSRIEVKAAQDHYDRGVTYAGEGHYQLAVAELELALQLDPDHEQAEDLLAEAQAALSSQPTATPMLQQETKEAYWNKLQQAAAQKDWAGTLETADQLLALDPEYRRQEVDLILFEAFYQLGQQYVQEDRLEEAVRTFDRALAIQPDSAQVAHAQDLAKLYMDGVRYWGADWPQTIDRLSTLYSLNPGYKDVRTRLRQAYANYGDQLAEEEDWCLASLEYRKALEIDASDDMVARAQEAMGLCETPSPPSDEGGESESPSPPGENEAEGFPDAPAGTFVGRIEDREQVASTKMFIRGKILDADEQPVVGARVKIQAWDWSAFATSDGSGQFSFDGLGNPVTYTLSLPDLPAQSLDVDTSWGEMTWVAFREAE